MHPDQPMADALRAELEPHARKLKKRLRGAARGDVDSIHEARITIRRLREGLVVMGRTLFDVAYVSKLGRDLRRIENALGPTRDDDVLASDLEVWTTAASLERREGLTPLAQHIRRQRRQDVRALRRALTRKTTKKVVRKLRRFLQREIPPAPAPKNPARATPTLVKHFVADETWWAYEEVLAYETRMPASIDVIHKVRSSCRGLRYALELFEGALPPGVADLIDALHALQDQLGDLHDHAVAASRIEQWRAEREVPDTEALTAYLDHHATERDRLRNEFEAEWKALTGNGFRYALSHLVSGEMGRTRPNGAVKLTTNGASLRER
jgi:CHAD domain-containing protein